MIGKMGFHFWGEEAWDPESYYEGFRFRYRRFLFPKSQLEFESLGLFSDEPDRKIIDLLILLSKNIKSFLFIVNWRDFFQ